MDCIDASERQEVEPACTSPASYMRTITTWDLPPDDEDALKVRRGILRNPCGSRNYWGRGGV